MKKLFTLCAAAALALSANAETKIDASVDFSTMTEVKLAWIPESQVEKFSIEDGALKISNPEATENFWDLQYNVVNLDLQASYDYTVKITLKGSVEGTMQTVKLGNWGEGPAKSIEFTTEYTEVTVTLSDVPQGGGFLMLQHGLYVGDLWIKSVEISHEEKEGKPVEWIEHLVNGDAEADWEDATVAFDDQEKNFTICSWSKDSQQNPVPSPIEEMVGPDGTMTRVFVVHATDCPTPDEDASAWDNQYWIQSPKAWAAGEQIKIEFDYKASQAATTNTQVHKQNPSDYLIWHAIGDINFTTEWQHFSKTFAWEGDMNNGWSIAFNLNSQIKTATDFYFDNLSWCTMKLDEGYFVAGDFNDWDLDEAVEMVLNEEEGYYEVTVGTTDKGATELKISTKRGNASAFDANTIQVTDAVEDDADTWNDWKKTSGDNPTLTHGKIKLPFPGVWKIYLDPEYEAMAFECVENAAGVEKPQETCRRIEVNAGAKVAEAWDNQFWIVANRTLAAGEVTHISFEYKATEEASASTQCHAEAGAYLHWAAIGTLNFNGEWKTLDMDFTVPAEGDGMQSIAFNLNDFADACDYMFRNISWTCGGESLIVNGDLATDDATSFVAKTNSDEATAGQILPAAIVEGATSLEAIKVESKETPIFNLSGQRVNNAKGLVIKNGKVMFVK